MASSKASFQLLLLAFLILLLTEYSIFLEAKSMANSSVENFKVGCIEEERKALLKFKQGLEDPLALLSSWVGEDCCKWIGVGCSNQTGNVIRLDLSNRPPNFYFGQANSETPRWPCLGGEISPSLLNLTYLNHLHLSYNHFHGIPIPNFIGSFKKLRYLDLSYSSFGGMVPPDLGNLSNLLHLDLTSGSLLIHPWVSDLNWLSGLSSLQYLGLGGMNLSKATTHWLPSVHMLPSLLELHLPFCELHDLPQSLPFVNFTSLLVVDLSFNYFNSSLPQWLFNISTLVKVGLIDCGITGSISQIAWGNLCSLQTLVISVNLISGEIKEFVDALSGCSNISLETLDLGMNKLRGSLPDSLGSLKHLDTLSLSYNAFSGPFPMSFFNLSHLRALDLSSNLMSGTIPESIGQLTKLNSLLLLDNQWEGVMSKSHLHNLSRLEHFSLSSKSCVFDVGHDWIPLFSLMSIEIRDCLLSSSFPAWLKTQKEISFMVLTSLTIFNTIPEWLWKFSKIVLLDLSNNHLRGELPQSISLEQSSTWVPTS